MATNFTKGKNLRLKFAGDKFYHAQECSLSISAKDEDVSTKDTQGDEIISDGYSYTISTSGLMAVLPDGTVGYITTGDLMRSLIAGTFLEWEFTDEVVGNDVYSGTVKISQGDITASNGSGATSSFSFKGSGDIVITVVPED